MASTVFANGNAVATSTTGHIAHVLPPGDIRLVPPAPTPTPFWNEVGSSKIFAGYPTKTMFQSGLVWVAGTKAGPMSTPIVTFPGQVSGGVDSYATSFEGSGSKNVIVEAKNVYCQTHLTWQNAKNSQGMINDAMGAAAAKAAFDAEQAKNKPAIGPDGGAGSTGGAKGDDGKADESDKPPETQAAPPPAEDKCECTAVLMTDAMSPHTTVGGKAMGPRQQNAEQAATDAKIQVVVDSTLSLKATLGKKICEKHTAEWSGPRGWSATGAEVKYKATEAVSMRSLSGGAALIPAGAVGAFLGGLAGKGSEGGEMAMNVVDVFRLASAKPVVDGIKCVTCFGTFNRNIEVFPDDKPKGDMKTEGFKKFTKKLETKICTNIAVKGKLEFGIFSGSISGGWAEQKNWKTLYELKAKGSGSIAKGSLSFKYSLLNMPLVIPALEAVKNIIKAINWLYDKIFGGTFFDVYIQLKLEANVSASVTVTAQKEYMGDWSYKDTKLDIGGTFKATLSIGMDVLSNAKGDALVRAEGYASFELEVKGALKLASPIMVDGEFSYGPVTLGVKLSWNLLMWIAPDPKETGWWARVKQVGVSALDGTFRSISGKGLSDSIEKKADVFEKRVCKLEPFPLFGS